jgi:hypothetical protein
MSVGIHASFPRVHVGNRRADSVYSLLGGIDASIPGICVGDGAGQPPLSSHQLWSFFYEARAFSSFHFVRP